MRLIFFIFLFFTSNFLWSQDAQNPCLANQDFHIVILGSSTAAGTGPSTADSTWVNRYRKHLQAINPNNTITNLAIGGTTTYHIMPNWFVAPPNRPAANPSNNVSQAVNLGADAIIVNMPSNDASNNFGVDEQMFNFLTIASVADSADIPVWVCTTQPKTPFGNAQDAIQLGVRDSVLVSFGNMAIDFWNGIALPSNDIDPQFDSGDGTHLNDAAHAILFSRVSDKNILTQIFEPSLGVDFSFEKYSILNPETCGDSATIIQASVSNLGMDSSDDIFIQHHIFNASNNSNLIIYDTITGGLDACESFDFDFSINTSEAATYSISSFLTTANDLISQNDTSATLLYSTVVAPIIFAQNDTICSGENGWLSVGFENVDHIFWYENLTDSTPIETGNTFSIPATNVAQSYFAEGISGDLFFKNSIFTTDISNKNWNGVMINLVAHEDLTVDSFSLKLFDEGTQGVFAYFKNGSYEGFENDPAAWNLWGLDTAEVLIADDFYTLNFGEKTLAQGDTLGIYFYLENPGARLSYNDLTDWASRSTDQLEVRSGSGITHTFGIIYFPRDWNGEVFYHHGFNPEGDCSSGRVEVELVISEPTVDLGENMTIYFDENILLDGGENFTQYFWNGIAGGQFYNIDSTNFGIGMHEIILDVENEFGCVATDTILITIETPLGIASNQLVNDNFQVFPNPANDFFWIKNLDSNVFEIQLFDVFGKKLLQRTARNNEIISTKNFPKGIYFLKIRNKNKNHWQVQKVIFE